VTGIYLHTSGTKIFNNYIKRFEYGIYLRDENEELTFTNNNISKNEISNCSYAIYLRANGMYNTFYKNYIIDNFDGITLYYFVNNSLRNNYVCSNSQYGIYLNINSDGNIVSRNICSFNRYGIRLKAVSFNEIFLNRCEGNVIGIYCCCGSVYNYLFSNSLIGNEMQANDGFINYYDNGIIGNYWDDYNGTDNDGDGIGDTPYRIPMGDNVDNFPLMEPIDNNPPEIPTIEGPPTGKRGEEYILMVNSTDSDNDDVFYFVYWGDGKTSGWLGPYPQSEQIDITHKYRKGQYNIRAKVKDVYGFVSDWSDPISVEIPRNRAKTIFWFHCFFERFSLLQNLQNIPR
jgi:parallel beta-helix repeat protein